MRRFFSDNSQLSLQKEFDQSILRASAQKAEPSIPTRIIQRIEDEKKAAEEERAKKSWEKLQTDRISIKGFTKPQPEINKPADNNRPEEEQKPEKAVEGKSNTLTDDEVDGLYEDKDTWHDLGGHK